MAYVRIEEATHAGDGERCLPRKENVLLRLPALQRISPYEGHAGTVGRAFSKNDIFAKILRMTHRWLLVARDFHIKRERCQHCGASKVTTTLSSTFPSTRYAKLGIITAKAPECIAQNVQSPN